LPQIAALPSKAFVETAVNNAKNDIIAAVGEVIEENILPQIAALPDKAFVETAVNKVIASVGEVIEENILPQINALPNKAFITDKLADLEGSVITRQRKEDQKVNLLIEFLQAKKVLAASEVKMLKTFEIFQTAS
jgi:hypothetical protein